MNGYQPEYAFCMQKTTYAGQDYIQRTRRVVTIHGGDSQILNSMMTLRHDGMMGRQQQKWRRTSVPRHTNVFQSAPGSYSKAISASILSGAKRIARSATFSNAFCSLSRSPRRSFTMLPGICSTHPAFSGTSFLA